MNARLNYILLSAFICGIAFSQKKTISKQQFIKDSTKIVRPPSVRPQLRVDDRTLFFKGQTINAGGIDAGVLLKEKLRITLGYYVIPTTVLKSISQSIDGVTYEGNYKMNYGAFNLEFAYLNTRFFSLGMPLEFGFGQNTISYMSSIGDGHITESKTGLTALSFFGLSGTFKPIRWFGLKVSGGYRKSLFNEIKELKFDGLYASFGLAIDFREIIKDIRMFNLKKRYRRNFKTMDTAVDLITD